MDVPCRLCRGGTRDRLHQRRQVGDLPVVAVGERLAPGYEARELLHLAAAEGALNVGDPTVEADGRPLLVPGLHPAVAVTGQGLVLHIRSIDHNTVTDHVDKALGHQAVRGGRTQSLSPRASYT